jgi:hypothetical protein
MPFGWLSVSPSTSIDLGSLSGANLQISTQKQVVPQLNLENNGVQDVEIV